MEAHIYISTGSGRFLRIPSAKNNKVFDFNHDEPVKPDERTAPERDELARTALEENELALLSLFDVADKDRQLRHLSRKYRKYDNGISLY